MDNKLQFFENPNFGQIRVAQNENDELLFCLADICKAIDLLNPSSVKSRLDDDQVQILDLHALKLSEGINGNTKANFVTESGFYDVLFQSNSPKVKPFRKWVTSEILPSIRKTGSYQAKPLTNLQMLQQTINAMVEQEHRVSDLETQVKEIKAQITTRPDYFSIAGFATLNGLSYGRKQCATLGRKASKLCKEKGIEPEQIHDPRFGLVKSYPSEVLKEVFNLDRTITIHVKVS
ncbi:BRO family protein [Capnocytophaga canimorsus]|uniref:BRO family protein n=1 Tax=Capnocytophaga canimorsus TaxID=28188 RepID=UPI0037D755B3